MIIFLSIYLFSVALSLLYFYMFDFQRFLGEKLGSEVYKEALFYSFAPPINIIIAGGVLVITIRKLNKYFFG